MITKINLRDQVKNILLQRMKAGELDAGDSISIAQLAKELEVSTTPIREALTQLEQVKIIMAIPNRGFIVTPIDEEDIKPLYQLIVALEVLAIENSDFDEKRIKSLKHIQKHFIKTDTAIDRIKADMDFHRTLTENYLNPTAQQILSDLKTRIFFYEKNFMDEHGFYNDSEKHHEVIIESLENGKIENAVHSLKANWMQILDF